MGVNPIFISTVSISKSVVFVAFSFAVLILIVITVLGVTIFIVFVCFILIIPIFKIRTFVSRTPSVHSTLPSRISCSSSSRRRPCNGRTANRTNYEELLDLDFPAGF